MVAKDEYTNILHIIKLFYQALEKYIIDGLYGKAYQALNFVPLGTLKTSIVN